MSVEDLSNTVNEVIADNPLSTITARANPELLNEAISRDIETAINDEVLLDQHGHTQGMKSYVVLPVLDAINDWQRRYREVLLSIQQAMERTTQELNYEAERQRVTADRRAEETAAQTEHMAQARYRDLAAQADMARKRYNDMLAENHGKFPQSFNPRVYMLALFSVGISEWFINYPTFREIYVPFFALAATAIVASIFAAASHYHGQALKQRLRMFGKSIEKRERIQAMLVLIIVSVFFVIALGAVTYARYGFIAAEFGLSSSLGPDLLGGGRATDSIEGRLFQTVVINILIWGLGSVVSYAYHDAIPHFSEARRDAQRTQDELAKFNRTLDEKREQISAKYTDKETALESRGRTQTEHLRTLRGLRTRVQNGRSDLLRQAGQQINSALANYRTTLVMNATRDGRALKFGPAKQGLAEFNTMELSYPTAELSAAFPE